MHNGDTVSAYPHVSSPKLVKKLYWGSIFGVYTENCEASLILVSVEHKSYFTLSIN
jgi:hypothetical protein